MTAPPPIAEDFISMVEDIDRHLTLPKVKRVWLPRDHDRQTTAAKFGAVILEDDSVGLLYVLLDDTLSRIRDIVAQQSWEGVAPVELARRFREANPERKALGLGALNAISQHVIRASRLPLDTETNSIASFDPRPDDRFGMVGFFPPLVKMLRKKDIDLTVIELKENLVREEPRFRVTLDPTALQQCNKILSTSTLLLNDSVDPILSNCGHADQVAIIGPSAGFLPDPLFARGLDTLGGNQVLETEAFIGRVEEEKKWGDTTRKYCIHRGTYPGYETLLERCAT